MIYTFTKLQKYTVGQLHNFIYQLHKSHIEISYFFQMKQT